MEYIEEIQIIMSESDIGIQHIYREGNQLADKLANIVMEQENGIQCTFKQLPSVCRNILNIDKAQIYTFRIRTKKINIHGDTFTFTGYS